MHPRLEAGAHPRGQRHDVVVAVFVADLVHGLERLAPRFGLRFFQQTGLALAALQRLRVHAQQSDRLAAPGVVKQFPRGGGEIRVDLRSVIQRARAGVSRKIRIAQLDLHRARV